MNATTLVVPEFHALLTLLILVGVIFLFVRGKPPLDLVSWGLLVTLIVTFQIFPLEDPVTGANLLDAPRLFAGFSNPAMITVVGLLIMGEGVSRTGVLSVVARWIQAISAGSWRRAMGLSLVVVAIGSAFLNNTPIVVIFIPILLSVSEEMKVSPSRLMMPLSFASILGGTCTLIGTSTNILIADYMVKTGLPPLGMFTFSALGIVLLVVGLLYLIFIAPSLLEDRRLPGGGDPSGNDRKRFTSQLQIQPSSPLIGRKMSELLKEEILQKVEIFRVVRGELVDFRPPFDEVVLKEGDTLLLSAGVKALKKLEWESQSTLAPYIPGSRIQEKTEQGNTTLAELVIPSGSNLVGQDLSQARFRNRFQVIVIGLCRRGRAVEGRITDETLQTGDLLLIEGLGSNIDALTRNPDVLLYWGVHESVIKAPKAPIAGAILGGMVLLAATGVTGMLTLATVGAFLMLATRCLTLRQAYQAISPQIVLLLVATLALGDAMQATGAATWLANTFVIATMGQQPWLVMSLFGLLVMVLTNVISNNATAVLMAPVAYSMAQTLGVNPMPFLMAVLFGANAAFASPIGYKTNLLVMSVGAYRFGDFLKAGLILNIVTWLLVSALIPYFWPF
ncbi:MAG: SLC13 family permease [Magnetococcales bacterium]|nr:SLC13 family permease [Magnetococcales bacterium]